MRSLPIRFTITTFGILIIAYSLYLLAVYEAQKFIIFQPKPVPDHYQYRYESIDTPVQPLDIKTKDGVLLNGLVIAHPNPKGLIVFYHGNGDNLTDLERPVKRLYKRGYHVLVWDYRAYGKTGGKLRYDALMSDALTVYKYADSAYQLPIVPFGVSLGTAFAAHAASECGTPKVLLQSPFYSLARLGPHYLPGVPYCLILKYPFDTHASLRNFKGKIGIIHGKKDKVIPVRQSFLLKDSLERTGFHLKVMPQCGHNNLALYPGYTTWLDQWLGAPLN